MTRLEPRPPRERLTPPSREMSDFFFEQRLYDFTNKNLSSFQTDDMKRYMEEHIDAKEKVGAMLLAFEYFNAISEIKLEYDKAEFLTYENTLYRKLKANIKWIGFTLLGVLLLSALLANLNDLVIYFGPYLQELTK